MSRLLSHELVLGQEIPLLIYGTAWKEESTAELTATALRSGFKGVDTANHPTGYDERRAGEGIALALASGIKREDLFVQTKFSPTFTHHPAKIPYDESQGIEAQIKESIEQTFSNLKLDYVDALILHAPYPNDEDTKAAWKVLESYVPEKVRQLGVSNTTLAQLQTLYEAATIKPVIVQNRFYRETGYDFQLRAFCKDHGIVYQAFWMVKNNPDVLESAIIASVAQTFGVEKELAFYLMVLCLGDLQVLDGTTKTERMIADLKAITDILGNDEKWQSLQPSAIVFKKLLWKLACEYRGPPPTLSSDKPE
ncbi:putative aldo-keto reductase [Xylaria venustula]|nr:putative aldo-keto reductase [Xylaria venustula]